MSFTIKLGPAGSPGKSTLEGIPMIKEMGLHTMEVQFVRGVKMTNDLAKKCGDKAKELGIDLSVHAPYYINLTSEEKDKRKASVKRILDSCERAHYLGAKYVTFHPAYYGKYKKEDVFDAVKKSILDMKGVIKKNGWETELAPETTGRVKQFGDIDESLRMMKETGCFLVIDFAHLFARNRGKIDYKEILDKVQDYKIKKIQCHFSGIEFGQGGERNHLVISEDKPPFNPLAKELMDRKLSATIISESPITWKDSLKMKEIFKGLGYKF
ncbi:MAG: TIM barrel protein [Nanoarchaeota archaeon]